MSTVPASQFVNVLPGVISAGGTELALSGMFIDNSTGRVPVGGVQSFPDQPSVSAFFGASSTIAARATTYFAGFDGSDAKPGAMLVATWPAVAVSAWLRGASIATLSLAQLQAISGTLSFTVDGNLKTGSINLSAATSFTNAAQIIAETLEIDGVATASATGSMGATFTGTGSGTNLTVSAVTGVIHPGDGNVVSGTGVPANTTILSQTSGTPGGAGVYVTNNATTSSGASLTLVSPTLDVTAISSGAIGINQVLAGTGVTDDTYVTALGTGTGGTGTYTTNTSQQFASTASLATTLPGVTYDSVSGGLIVNSGTTGAGSTMTYGSGTAAAALNMTQVAGAALSQGSAAQTPAAFMGGLTQLTQNWASFSLTFNPDQSGIAQRLAFAQWNAQQNNRWLCVLADTDTTPATSLLATASLGYQVRKALQLSGTMVLWYGTTVAQHFAAFLQGAVASIDFEEPDGRADLAYRSQSGLTPAVTDAATFANLLANGYGFYVAAATANQGFNFLYDGSIAGPFLWIDSYVNQIWMNAQFQLDLMTTRTTVKSIPFNPDGATLIQASVVPTIDAAISNGVIRQNVEVSASQAAAANAAAGKKIDQVLSTRGWYLLVVAASAAVRQARGPQACKFFYTDGQDVQTINLTSTELT